jgi:hypothetical protein
MEYFGVGHMISRSSLCKPSQTIKHGCGGIMIWGSMYIHGPGLVCKVEGHINQHFYHEILEQNVCRTIQKFQLDPFHVIFQQDNAPVYTTKMLQEWFSRQCFTLLPWLAQFLDLNSIEHLWAILKRRLNRYEKLPKGMIELWDRIVEVYYSIPSNDCRRLVESVSRRIAARVVRTPVRPPVTPDRPSCPPNKEIFEYI